MFSSRRHILRSLWRAQIQVLLLLCGKSLVSAVVLSTVFEDLQGGDNVTITWSGAVGGAALTLNPSRQEDLGVLGTIGSNLQGTSYIWNVPLSVPTGTYSIEIQDSIGDSDHIVDFQIHQALGFISSITSDLLDVLTSTVTVGLRRRRRRRGSFYSCQWWE
ncbi:hypothetical protein ONS95_005152 [Cadophora gregata]|uniref:uncharacterized protein n=1 Tax=Cadophora gregata TaxID=51156 RepID=UPI0026DB5066|nr:uncharacterized protein ONS95_005152 [Cadophora gregata]KAK0104886.1 hypothetical protein ONS95_005152 [Cadophora gregata]KAK0115034.1 hypothetical protein ONS96_013504 [Cadophora gregata f. sp. sojae]